MSITTRAEALKNNGLTRLGLFKEILVF